MSNGLRPTTERFDGSKGRVDQMEGSSSFMLDNDNINNNNNKVGMVEHQSMQRSTLFPESLTINFGIALESPMDGLGGTFPGLVEYANDLMRPPFLG
jgi:hypothetical protein